MEKELLELFDSAKKAADAAAADGVSPGGADEQRCVDALKQMKKVPVTMKVLVDTQVGRKIRSLTKHPQKKIKAVASELFEMWKSIVVEEAKNKPNGSTDVTSSSMSSTTSSMTVEVSRVEAVNVQNVHQSNSVRVENVSRAETIKVEKTDHSMIRSEKVSRSETVKVQRVQNVKVEKNGEGEPVKVEKVVKEEKQTSGVKRPLQAPNGIPKLTSMIKSNDSGRDKVRELLAEALSKVSSEIEEDRIDEVNVSDPIRVAVSVESVLFDKWGKSTGQHKFKYRSVMFNIKDAKNPDLRRRILLGEIKPERLITMTPEEMASDQRKQENTQIKEKALFECERAGAPKATTDQFKCGRCQQRKTTYYQLQTRSADEPMTTFVTCVNCNNHWKFC